MNLEEFVDEHINEIQKDKITNITRHKIKYISDYINNWLYVVENHPESKYINFIDCMCNAGIYNDGTLSTAIEVLKLFKIHSINHPEKIYNLFLNDIDSSRIKVIEQLIQKLNIDAANIKVYYDNMDVNTYLKSFEKYSQNFVFGSYSVLFVDPYDFGTVNVSLIRNFSERYYTETIFNYFSSDYRRNIHNATAENKIEKIKKSLLGVLEYKETMSDEEVLKVIQDYFKTSKIKYSFAYPFKTKTNVVLYSIVYSTPHLKGLEKIKDSIWKTFDGKEFYKNEDESEKYQLALFDDEEMTINYYSLECKKMILEKFNKQRVKFDEIKEFVLENTMLKSGHIIQYVIKPLIEEGKMVKANKLGPKKYIGDDYTVGAYDE